MPPFFFKLNIFYNCPDKVILAEKGDPTLAWCVE